MKRAFPLRERRWRSKKSPSRFSTSAGRLAHTARASGVSRSSRRIFRASSWRCLPLREARYASHEDGRARTGQRSSIATDADSPHAGASWGSTVTVGDVPGTA